MRNRAGLYWRLDHQHRPVECSQREWGEMFSDDAKRRVAQTNTRFHMISTVFLGIDHGWSDSGPPILFESMSFRLQEEIDKAGVDVTDWEEQDCERYASWDDAVTGHKAMVSKFERIEAASDVVAIFEKIKASSNLDKLPKIRAAKNTSTVTGGNDD